MRIFFSPLLFPLLLGLAACAGKPPPVVKPPDPELTFLRRDISPGLCQTRLDLIFMLRNLSPDTLKLSHWTASLTKNGAALPSQEHTLEGSITSQDERELGLPLTLEHGCAGNTFGRGQNMDKVSVTGKIFARGGGEIVFEFDDETELPAPKLPDLKVEIDAQRYDGGRVEMFVHIKLHNPNPFSVLIDALEYRFEANGVEALKGAVAEGDRVREKSVLTYEVPFRVEPDEKGPHGELARLGSFKYLLDAKLMIGGTTYPMPKTGAVSF